MWRKGSVIDSYCFPLWLRLVPTIREGNGIPLQYSCLENPMDGGAWWAAVHGVTKSWTRLSDFTFTFHFHALEKEMATHSSVLAWRIPGTGEAGGLLSVVMHRVGHHWSDLAAAAAYLNSLVVCPTFFNLSLNLVITCLWSEPQSTPGLVFVDYIELLHLWLQII